MEETGEVRKYQVFISSTYEDLKDIRTDITLAVLKTKNIPAGMEDFSASDDRGWEIVTHTIDNSDLYVLIIAGLYGSIDPKTGKSWTEKEYDYARHKGLPVLAFIRDRNKILQKDSEIEPRKAEKLQNFIKKVELKKLRERWQESSDLQYKVSNALRDEIERLKPTGRLLGWYRGSPPISKKEVTAYNTPFIFVQGGTFQMGTASGGDENERPVHSVTLKSFHISKYEVTQKEWKDIMGTTVQQQRYAANREWPLRGEGDNYPMYYVNWYEAIEYCNKRSTKEGITPVYYGSGDSITCDFNANGYRLLTEAEWEYAAKGGANSAYLTYVYSGSNSAESVAWYIENSKEMTYPVGKKQPNDLGIYDMSGNLWEWCWDWYGSYAEGSQTDPVGPASGSYRVNRGGSWNYAEQFLRSAHRYYFAPNARGGNVGFRVARR